MPSYFPKEKHVAAGLTCKREAGAANINGIIPKKLLHLRSFLVKPG